jgi:hypothetical protein
MFQLCKKICPTKDVLSKEVILKINLPALLLYKKRRILPKFITMHYVVYYADNKVKDGFHSMFSYGS